MPKTDRKPNWPLRIYIAAVVMLFSGIAVVSFIKLAAWWRVAFGSC